MDCNKFLESLKFQGKTEKETLSIKSNEEFLNLKGEVIKELNELICENSASNNIIEFKVPKGFKYISDIPGYSFPLGHSIIDKKITGCGMTEFSLRNSENIILCSPRKILLENKVSQRIFNGDPNLNSIFYLNYGEDRDYEEVEKLREIENKKNRYRSSSVFNFKENKISSKAYFENLKNSFQDTSLLSESDKKGIKDLKSQIIDHYFKCINLGIPCKFLVTYDSFPKLFHILEEEGRLMSNFRVVVDEFQSIFMDSSFKPDIEDVFLGKLKLCSNVTYISATPMLDKYLNKLDSFKGLPFIKFNWESDDITCPLIKRVRVNSIYKSIIDVISKYREGKFPVQVDSMGSTVESKEAVFYVNSVKTIRDLIKSCNLSPNEVNILCSRSKFNVDVLSRVGHSIGSIPNRGEPHKMFTFCTRTVYLGADFYSTNASTYVVATPKVKTLMLDISLDLPQIIGRQRLSSNPFKDMCTVFYESNDSRFLPDKDEFIDYISRKDKQTNSVLTYMSFDDVPEDAYIDLAALIHKGLLESGDKFYLRWDVESCSIVRNPLARLSELRSWEVSRFEYQDKVFLFKSLEESRLSSSLFPISGEDEVSSYPKAMLVKDMILEGTLPNLPSNLKLKAQVRMYSYCVVMGDQFISDYLKSKVSSMLPLEYDCFYRLLGPERCLDLCMRKGFDFDHLRDEVKMRFITEEAKDLLRRHFIIGERISIPDAKKLAVEFSKVLGLFRYKFKYSDFSKYVDFFRSTMSAPNSKVQENCLAVRKLLI